MRILASPCLLAVSVLAAAGCASGPKTATPEGFFHLFADCREEYVDIEKRITEAGVRNPSFYTVPGFPYFRSNRLHASFVGELDTPEKLFGWMRRMREFDQESREFEYMNMGMTLKQRGGLRHRFLGCGQTLAALEAELPGNLELMKAGAQPPKAKNRMAGLFGFGGPSKSDIEKQHARWHAQLRTPVSELKSDGPLARLKVKAVQDQALIKHRFEKTIPDELGFPGLYDSAWVALAERHAPMLWLETASERDIPGTPVWTDEGIDVDPSNPRLYFHIGFTRFGKVPAVQISYYAWFRGVESGPRIDGTVWRVNLDLAMEPIAYEFAHASGRDHLWFPVQRMDRTRHGDNNDLLSPEAFVADTRAPSTGVTMRLKAGSHEMRRVVSEIEAQQGEQGEYELHRFEDLYFLPTPNGSTDNLFAPDGHVEQSDPKAPLQHFTRMQVYPGRTHYFDEPFLMQSVFEPPANPVTLHNPFASDAS